MCNLEDEFHLKQHSGSYLLEGINLLGLEMHHLHTGTEDLLFSVEDED